MAHEVAHVVSIKSVTRSICSIYRLKICVFPIHNGLPFVG